MIRVLCFLLLIFPLLANAIEWNDPDCGKLNKYHGKVFEFNASMSFHGDIDIKLCKDNDTHFLTVSTKIPSGNNDLTEEWKRIDLKKEIVPKIMESYENAMRYNTLDKVMGPDGSSWCIESQHGFTYTKACFWSPGYKSEERGLSGLRDLGIYLWEISGLEKANIKLY